VKKIRAPNPKRRVQIAIIAGIAIVASVIAFSYYLDEASLQGQKFGNDLALIQSDLKNETASFDANLTLYENGKISKDDMLNITDSHLAKMQNILAKYDTLDAPEPFVPSLQLFRLSTATQLESDDALKDWILTGDNATRAKSDQLLQQSFQYEINALASYNNAKSGNSQ